MVCALTLPGARPPLIELQGLIDTGADVTVTSLSVWPPAWPLAPVGTPVVGVGGPERTMVSQSFVLVGNTRGQVAAVQPFIISAPVALWGQDVLPAWGVQIGADWWIFDRGHCIKG